MPRLPSVTVDDVLSWSPCYDEERVRRVLGARKRWNALNILSLNIPIPDRLWAIHRNAMLPMALWKWLCCDYAGSVVYIYESHAPGDVTLRMCLDAARAARGAGYAARAARYAARATGVALGAMYAARASLNAARATDVALGAWYVAWASWNAARAASVAWGTEDAERAWQIDHARTLIAGWRDWPTDNVREYLSTLTPTENEEK